MLPFRFQLFGRTAGSYVLDFRVSYTLGKCAWFSTPAIKRDYMACGHETEYWFCVLLHVLSLYTRFEHQSCLIIHGCGDRWSSDNND